MCSIFTSLSQRASLTRVHELEPKTAPAGLAAGDYNVRTSQDQTHHFTGTMNYELPVGKNRHRLNQANRLLDALLGGYNLASTYTIASGLPAGMSISGVPAFSLGNNGANVWNNQRIMAASGSIGKEVPVKGERMRLQLRLDWQNPFKWYNWGGPATALNVQTAANALTFGKINPESNGETATGTAGYGGTPLLNINIALKW